MAIFTTLSMVIYFSMGTLGIFATLVYVFTMRVVIYDILSMLYIIIGLFFFYILFLSKRIGPIVGQFGNNYIFSLELWWKFKVLTF